MLAIGSGSMPVARSTFVCATVVVAVGCEAMAMRAAPRVGFWQAAVRPAMNLRRTRAQVMLCHVAAADFCGNRNGDTRDGACELWMAAAPLDLQVAFFRMTSGLLRRASQRPFRCY
jgi:hypothetical protein